MAERKEDTSERDSTSPVALQAPLTIVRPVRDDLERHLPKPCEFLLSVIFVSFLAVSIGAVFKLKFSVTSPPTTLVKRLDNVLEHCEVWC
jgi:hypothetical protein